MDTIDREKLWAQIEEQNKRKEIEKRINQEISDSMGQMHALQQRFNGAPRAANVTAGVYDNLPPRMTFAEIQDVFTISNDKARAWKGMTLRFAFDVDFTKELDDWQKKIVLKSLMVKAIQYLNSDEYLKDINISEGSENSHG